VPTFNAELELCLGVLSEVGAGLRLAPKLGVDVPATKLNQLPSRLIVTQYDAFAQRAIPGDALCVFFCFGL
jgi:hypothetical protein